VIKISNIFIGMLLVFLNFSLNIGASKIELLPGFIGYYVMLKGLAQIEAFSGRFKKIMPYVKVMIVYAGICYAIDSSGISTEIEVFYNAWPLFLPFLYLGLIAMPLLVSRVFLFFLPETIRHTRPFSLADVRACARISVARRRPVRSLLECQSRMLRRYPLVSR